MNKKRYPISFLAVGMLVIAIQLASVQPASAIHSRIAILAMPSRSAGETQSLTRVYTEPEDTGQVINVLLPGTQVQILGLSESGAWMAIPQAYPPYLVAWIPAADVRSDIMVGSTRSLVLTRQHPDSTSMVMDVLSPGARVQVLGRSVDNSWIAISTPGDPQTSISWIATSELRLPDASATTIYFTKFYAIPDESSRVTSVTTPTHSVALIGRNSAGTWFATANLRTDQFIGWVQSSHLDGGMDWSLLPILSDR